MHMHLTCFSLRITNLFASWFSGFQWLFKMILENVLSALYLNLSKSFCLSNSNSSQACDWLATYYHRVKVFLQPVTFDTDHWMYWIKCMCVNMTWITECTWYRSIYISILFTQNDHIVQNQVPYRPFSLQSFFLNHLVTLKSHCCPFSQNS